MLTLITYRAYEGMELNPHNWDHTFRVAQHGIKHRRG